MQFGHDRRHSSLVTIRQNPANQTLTVRLLRQRLQHLRPEPGPAQRRVVHRDGSAAMSDNSAVTRALNAARARTCFDPSVRSPDRLGSRAPLQAHFWIGKDSAAGNFTPPAGWRSRLDAVDQVVHRRSILSAESPAAQTPSSVNFAGPVCFTRIRDGTPPPRRPLAPKWSRGPIGDGLASRFTIYGWLTLCWRI